MKFPVKFPVMARLAASLSSWRKGHPLTKEVPDISDSERLFGYARQALEQGCPDRARIMLGFGEILAGGTEKVQYLLDAGRMWQEFHDLDQAYDRLLEAEFQAELHAKPLRAAIQCRLLNLESTLALEYATTHCAPHAGFWLCMMARRAGTKLDLPLEAAWQELEAAGDAATAPTRALHAVQLFAIAHCAGLSAGSLQKVVNYVAQAPTSLAVLHKLRGCVQSLLPWKNLAPVTMPWFEVLEAVVREQGNPS